MLFNEEEGLITEEFCMTLSFIMDLFCMTGVPVRLIGAPDL